MEYKIIEETRQYFIEKYGVPSAQKIGNMTYKVLNHDLDAFNDFISTLLKVVEKCNLQNVEKQINLICEYCKQAEPVNLEKITVKLKGILNNLSKSINYSKYSFIKMFKDIETVADDFNPNLLENYFEMYLKVHLYKFNIKTNRRTVDTRGDSFWARNKGLEDNNI